MRLTTKGRYAVTAMLDLAIHNENGPISLADISKRQGISLSYLEQLFARLRKQGLVVSTRGPGGGYTLSRPASDTPIADVISAVDEKVDTTRCGGTADCHNNQRCLTHDLWTDLSDQIRRFLTDITLADVMARNGVQEVAARQDRGTAQRVVMRRPETSRVD
ncbi:Fe-S cluster assembly transcription factor [Thioalkalivibrio thiocyanodenitrificans]|uniref:Fe-S cluster assembly transcription factor n=1 Tax=Thioalkalivibrio thiocyanodenitrificans TaxID=243063 RepID=UPI00037617AA|nr:Fe-S cluster assembly transcription factor [Thioalkalivibrio thiocyanodenitrificans]